jgi:hypothetical protein
VDGLVDGLVNGLVDGLVGWWMVWWVDERKTWKADAKEKARERLFLHSEGRVSFLYFSL